MASHAPGYDDFVMRPRFLISFLLNQVTPSREEQGRKASLHFHQAARESSRRAFDPGATKRLRGQVWRRDLVDRANDLQKITTSPQNAYRLSQILGEIDVRPLLKEIRAPTLVLHTRGDARVHFTEGQELAAGIKGARFVPLESNNHLLLAGEPAWPVFLREVRDFLAK